MFATSHVFKSRPSRARARGFRYPFLIAIVRSFLPGAFRFEIALKMPVPIFIRGHFVQHFVYGIHTDTFC